MRRERGPVVPPRGVARAALLLLGLPACALLTHVDDLSIGNDVDGGADGMTLGDASVDTRGSDAPVDGGGSADADAGASCGFAGPTAGLLAYYPFEEGSGDAVHDCSGNHLDGTFVHQVDGGSWATGKHGGAIRVQAPNGCVDLGAPPKLQPPTLTVAMWINVASFPSGISSGYIVGQSLNADVDGWRIGSRTVDGGGELSWLSSVSGTSYQFGTAAPAVATWHHLAVTFAPKDTLQIFVDGTNTVSQRGYPGIAFSTASLRIGCRADDANYFAGLIDEVRLYDRVLSAAEITTLALP